MKNNYQPEPAVIENIVDETTDVKTFTSHLKNKKSGILKYKPGQFLILSIPGYGEAPFTFSSMPALGGKFQVSVKKTGALTAALHNLKVKSIVGVRGPYGNSFPLDKLKNKNILFVAGGIGLAPLRPLIQYIFKSRKNYGKVEIVYGCRTPQDMVYKNEIESWRNNQNTEVHLTVDIPDEGWGGTCGVVCVLFPRVKLNPKTTMAILCGPPVMIKNASPDILKLGFKEDNIYVSLERYMKCGIGKCGHCYVKGKYICTDGPNFSYAQMKKLGIDS